MAGRRFSAFLGATCVATGLALAGAAVAVHSAGADTPPPSSEEMARLRNAPAVVVPPVGQAGCDAAPVAGAAITDGELIVSSIAIEGAVRVTAADLATETQSLIGRSVDRATLDRLGERVGCVYRQRGLLAAKAAVEPAETPGAWRLRIVEGRVEGVVVNTGDVDLDNFLRRAFGRVVLGQPLQADAVRQGLALSARHAVWGVTVKAAPGVDDPSSLTLVIDAPKPKTVVFTSVQNNAPDSVGRWWAGASVVGHGATPLYEQTSVGVFHSLTDERQRGVTVSSQALVGDKGLGARIDLSLFEQTPDEKPPLADTHGVTRLARVELEKPLVAAPDLMVTGRAGVEAVGQRTELLGGPTTVRDDLRVGYVGLHADASRGETALSGDLSLRQGLGVAGASRAGDPLLSRPDADPQATVVRAEASVRRPVLGGTGQARVRGQWTNDALLAFEEFTFGGAPGGRGLDAGALYGDSGLAVGLDWFGPQKRVGPVTISPLAFVEGAVARNRDDYGARESSIALSGGGFRVKLGDRAQLDVVFARPVGKAKGVDEDRFGPRLLVTLTSTFGGDR